MIKYKITEFFVSIDDFCLGFELEIQKHLLESSTQKSRKRAASLADSEIMSILVMFHHGQFSNFKSYYNHYVSVHMTDLFPGLVSYNRFIELQGRVAIPLMLFLKLEGLGRATGISFVDSTPLRSCHNRRIHQHKTFKGIAERGQCSLGWFFRFKLHLIIRYKGEILSFYLTKENVDDRNLKVMKSMTENLFGKLFGDKGYISKAFSDLLFGNGIQLIAKPKKNMKNQSILPNDRILLRKRAIIECVNDELKNMCKLEHTRHRSVNNFLINIRGALTAYCFFPKKPSLNIEFELPTVQLSLSA